MTFSPVVPRYVCHDGQAIKYFCNAWPETVAAIRAGGTFVERLKPDIDERYLIVASGLVLDASGSVATVPDPAPEPDSETDFQP